LSEKCSKGGKMKRRNRKFVGAVVLLGLVTIYGPLAMALAESRILAAPVWIQTLAYMALGLAWVLPAMPIIRWMQKPDSH
jgi:hypothetical protein